MVPTANLIAFALVSIPIILIPGPSVLFAIGRALALGRIGGLLSVLGNGVGILVAVVAVAVGVGYLLAESLILFTVVKVAGAGYLIYLGIQAIRHRSARADAMSVEVPPTARWKLLVQGFIVGLTNPKTIVFFVAVLPQFVDYQAGSIPLQLLTLGLIFVAIGVPSDAVWALAAGFARDWFAKSPRRISTLSATGGVLMIGLGTASLFVGHGKD